MTWPHVQHQRSVHLLSAIESLPDLDVPVILAFQVCQASPSPSDQVLIWHWLVLGAAYGTGLAGAGLTRTQA